MCARPPRRLLWAAPPNPPDSLPEPSFLCFSPCLPLSQERIRSLDRSKTELVLGLTQEILQLLQLQPLPLPLPPGTH